MAVLDALILSSELTEDEAKSVRALHSGHYDQLRLLQYPPIKQVGWKIIMNLSWVLIQIGGTIRIVQLASRIVNTLPLTD